MSETQKRGFGLIWGSLIVILGAVFLWGAISPEIAELCTSIGIGSWYMPHGHCYQWEPGLLWLHVLSDLLIGLSYFSIPVALLLFVRKRPQALFGRLVLLFGLFICLCGLTHFLAVWNVWEATYWVTGIAKAGTAVVSLLTAVVLFKGLPAALAIPLPQEYSKVSRQLEEEAESRKVVEKKLHVREGRQTAALWKSDSRWRLLTEFIYSATWRSDEKGEVKHPMPRWEEFTGQGEKEYFGFGWLSAYHEDDREALRLEWEACSAAGVPFDCEARLWNAAEKRYCAVATRGIPIRDDAGEVHEWLGAVYDLTHLKAQQQQVELYAKRLEEQNRYLNDFASVASHDLREPLRKVQAYGEILQEDFASELSSEGVHCVEVMRSAATRMAALIDDVLEYAKVSEKELSWVEVDAAELFSAAKEDLEIALIETEAEVVAREMCRVRVDEIQMRRVLTNLLGNAVKYRSSDRKLRIEIAAFPFADLGELDERDSSKSWSDGGVCIEVKDNGIGFDETKSKQILKPFERLHARGSIPGAGIGLAICHRIVERHGGEIRISSQIDVGSRFRIIIPTSASSSLHVDN